MAYTLEVDFDVYKSVFARRANESVTENDVLRELLGLPPKQLVAGAATAQVEQPRSREASSPEDWIVKNVRFPAGTDFRATHKGRTYTGRVQGGALGVDGKSYDSPSAAAVAITGNAVNGWRFWECRIPGKSTWQLIEGLRR
jgi:hypothetical protein